MTIAKRTKKTPAPTKAAVLKEAPVKKPTIKDLEAQVANLTEQLVYANNKAVELMKEVEDVRSLESYYIVEYQKHLTERSQLLAERDALSAMSPWQFFKKRVGL